jgi:hypothetical protein
MRKTQLIVSCVLLVLLFVLSGCSKDDFRSQYVGRYEGTIKLALVVKGIDQTSERDFYLDLDPSDDNALLISRAIPIDLIKLRWINGEWQVSLLATSSNCPHSAELFGDVTLSPDSIRMNLVMFDDNPEIIEKDTLIITSAARKVKF